MVANHVSFFGAKLDKVLAAAARTRPCESLRQSFILAATGVIVPYLEDHSHLGHEKNSLTFHCTGCFIGILIMVYCSHNPHVTV